MKNISNIFKVLVFSTFIFSSCSDKPTKTKADCKTQDQSAAYKFGRDVRTFTDITGSNMKLSDAIISYAESIGQGWLAELYKAEDECVQAGFEKN